MADPTNFLENISLAVTGAARDALIAQAAQLPDDRAEVLVACADASSYGHAVMVKRYAVGGLVGLLLGASAMWLYERSQASGRRSEAYRSGWGARASEQSYRRAKKKRN